MCVVVVEVVVVRFVVGVNWWVGLCGNNLAMGSVLGGLGTDVSNDVVCTHGAVAGQSIVIRYYNKYSTMGAC